MSQSLSESFVEIGVVVTKEIIPQEIRRQKIVAAVLEAVRVDKMFEVVVVFGTQKLKHCPLIRADLRRKNFQQAGSVRIHRQQLAQVVRIN